MAKGKGKRRQGRKLGILGFVRPALLFMLVQEDAHGYLLLDGLSEFRYDTSQLDPSVIYRVLREMEDMGWVESYLGEESLGPQRKIYRLLPEGKEQLDEHIKHLRRRRNEIDHLLQAYDQKFSEK